MDEQLATHLQKLIDHQHNKVLKVARDIHPNLTPEDIRNPQDFPELYRDPVFNYEDGILTGFLSMQLSVRRFFNEDLS